MSRCSMSIRVPSSFIHPQFGAGYAYIQISERASQAESSNWHLRRDPRDILLQALANDSARHLSTTGHCIHERNPKISPGSADQQGKYVPAAVEPPLPPLTARRGGADKALRPTHTTSGHRQSALHRRGGKSG